VQALLQCYSSAEQVGNFIRNVLARLLPSDLLGSRHNHRKFYEAVFRFIALRRNETVLLTEFMHGIEVAVGVSFFFYLKLLFYYWHYYSQGLCLSVGLGQRRG